MTRRRCLLRSLVSASLVVLVAAAFVRAQSSGFEATRTELRRQAQAAQQAEGLAGNANRKALFAKYPTPEIALAKSLSLRPGAAAPLSLTGKFAPGTSLAADSEAIALADVQVTATSVKATVKAADGLAPRWARVYAFAPVSLAETWVPVFVGVPHSYVLKASNGWTVKVAPDAPAFAVADNEARVGYKAEYFKAAEATPFQTTTGYLALNANDRGAVRYTFMLSAGQAGSAMEEMQELSKKMVELMQAGKVGTKEFDAIQKKVDAAQERFAKEMEAQMADPAAAQRKQDAFGCESIFLTADGPKVTGSISCGKDVGTLQVTGTPAS